MHNKLLCSCTEHEWIRCSLSLNLKRNSTLGERELFKSAVGPLFSFFLMAHLGDRKTCIGAISFQHIQHSSFIRLPFLSLIDWRLCSYLTRALYTHTQNHRDESRRTAKRLFEFETGAPQKICQTSKQSRLLKKALPLGWGEGEGDIKQ